MADLFTSLLRRVGRIIEPLVDPNAADRRRREAAASKHLEGVGASLSKLSRQVERVTERVDAIDRHQLDDLERAVSTLQLNTRRQASLADRLVRATHHDHEHELVRERALRRLQQLTRGTGPVLVGPWTGEVGFELLYWAPFVRWAIHKFRIDPARITLLSRGGTASWYGIEGARYRDVFELNSPEQFRAGTAQAMKQRTLRLFDRTLIRRVANSMGERPGLLHPAIMYALFMPYWKQQTSRRRVEEFSEYARITPPVIPGLQLPREYVAVRFYFSDCFPDTADNRAVVRSVIQSLTAGTDVVLLGSGVRVDDHHDFEMPRSDRVHTVDHVMRPENNLAVQTAVIAGAKSFIGTYGGFSYLAPMCGVNTVALYSQRTFFTYHMDFAQQIFDTIRGGSLTVIDAASRSLMRHLAPPAAS